MTMLRLLLLFCLPGLTMMKAVSGATGRRFSLPFILPWARREGFWAVLVISQFEVG